MRDSFVLHTAYAEKFKRLTDEQFGKLIRLLMIYQSTGEEKTIDDSLVACAFDVAKVELDITNKKYAEVCEKRKIAGSMGGLAKASKCKQTLAKASKSSKTYHKDKDKDKDNDNEKDKDKENLKNIIPPINPPTGDKRYFPNDELLEKTFKDFREMRKKTKHPMTDRAIELMLSKLEKLSTDPVEQVKILEQSILHGWTDIYELKEDQGRKQTKIESIADRWADVH